MVRDFFHVDTVLLRRLYVLVLIDHDTRLLRIAGMTAKPIADWVIQEARNLSMELEDGASPIKLLIRDRDTKFTGSFDAVLADYVEHDNAHRPHRPLGPRAPSVLGSPPAPIDDIDPAKVRRTDRLGGVIREYRMAA